MIKIFEVGPRDGLQNEKEILATKDKITYIEKLEKAGIQNIEVGAFVRPDRIPQLADTYEVLEGLHLQETTNISVLVPNIQGFEKAVEAGLKEVAVFTAASETFNQKNTNASIEESFQRFKEIFERADHLDIRVRGYVSTCFFCPFEGIITKEQVLPVLERLLEMGCYEVSVGDTIGKATSKQVQDLFTYTSTYGLNGWLAGHFHDTYGLALENVGESLNHQIKTFDASSGGTGGCPYAPGASGNLATEDLVDYLEKNNIPTGVNLAKLVEASRFVEEKLQRKLPSKIYQDLK